MKVYQTRRVFLSDSLAIGVCTLTLLRQSSAFAFFDSNANFPLTDIIKLPLWDPRQKKLDESGFSPVILEKAKVIYVDFWASWCTPCRYSFPFMNEIHDKYSKHGLVILAVSVDKDESKFTEFLTQHPPRFSTLWDRSATISKLVNPRAMPTSYIIEESRVVSEHRGFTRSIANDTEIRIKNALRL